jgi:hypothetical protein
MFLFIEKSIAAEPELPDISQWLKTGLFSAESYL